MFAALSPVLRLSFGTLPISACSVRMQQKTPRNYAEKSVVALYADRSGEDQDNDIVLGSIDAPNKLVSIN